MMGAAARALKGRSEKMEVSPTHFVLKTPMEGPWPANMKVCVLANGCFWGSEKGFWRLPGGGVHSTAVGYAAGQTANPNYEECCSGRTGATEAVQVVYDPEKISMVDLLRWFWESHDPTQGDRQGNDRGTQYRSALIYFDSEQEQLMRASKDAYEKALKAAGKGEGSGITTEIVAASNFHGPWRPFTTRRITISSTWPNLEPGRIAAPSLSRNGRQKPWRTMRPSYPRSFGGNMPQSRIV